MRPKFVAGNWKMHGSLATNESLLRELLGDLGASAGVSECAVCVPYPYLSQVAELLSGSSIGWGAQNVSQHAQGAFTGEVSAGMLKDFGCRYVIVGHSERRTLFGESSDLVAEKTSVALGAGLTPIVCVGETLEQRESGITEQIVGDQIDAVVNRCGIDALVRCVVAYEPVWAIGTGRTATPEQAQAVHAYIRGRLGLSSMAVADAVRILYGGSVKAQNAGELFGQPDIDGGLIGGASLVAADFAAIVRAAG